MKIHFNEKTIDFGEITEKEEIDILILLLKKMESDTNKDEKESSIQTRKEKNI